MIIRACTPPLSVEHLPDRPVAAMPGCVLRYLDLLIRIDVGLMGPIKLACLLKFLVNPLGELKLLLGTETTRERAASPICTAAAVVY